MTHVLRSTLCRLLIALMAWAPYQMASASMVGTDQVVASAAQSDRAHVLGLLERGDVAGKLQAYGIDPAQAKDRVQAMSDEEVGSLAQKIDALPAGGLDGGGLIVLLIIAGVIWWAFTKGPR
jgi:hypothetical protein